LLLVNALFAGSEMALVSLRDSQVRRLESEGGSGKAVADLTADPNRFLSTIQIGITLAGFLASATAAVSLAEPLAQLMGFLGEAAEPVAVLLVTLVLTYLTLVLGELAPKRLAMQRAEGWSRLAARPLAFLARLSSPAVRFLGASTDLVIRLLGGDPARGREPITEEELRDLIVSQESLTPHERQVVKGALEVGERTLAQVLRPRPDVFVLDSSTAAAEALDRLVDAGFSRAPVVENGDLDELLGIVHARDLVGRGSSVGELAGRALVLPDSLNALDALRRLQRERQQLAVVLDEHQTAAGVVSVEDLVEEIVGEIYDEADRDVRSVERLPDGSLLLPGSFPVHDLEDLQVEVPAGPYTTLAGFVQHNLPFIPEGPGPEVTAGAHRFRVTKMDERRIVQVRVRREDVQPGEDQGGEGD
jgi:putative hemolysin